MKSSKTKKVKMKTKATNNTFKVYKDGKLLVALYHSPCEKVLPKIPTGKIDLIFTDPPYNLHDVSKGEMNIPGRENVNKLGDWDKGYVLEDNVEEYQRVLKSEGNIAIFCPYHLWGRYHQAYDLALDVVVPFIYAKTNPTPKFRKVSFLQATEFVMMAWNKPHYLNFIAQNQMKNYAEYPICMGNERLKGDDGKALHKTQKSLKICRHIIERLGRPKGWCLDPFMGVASIGIAALEHGMGYIGIEKEKRFFEASRSRIQDYLTRPE